MSGRCAMRRANGDWFAFEEQGSLRVPVFRSSRDAMREREHHRGMRPFKPIVFDEGVRGALALLLHEPTGRLQG